MRRKRYLPHCGNYRGIIHLLWVLFLLWVIACDSNQYSKQANELIDSIHILLISEKFCDNKKDCHEKQYVFYEGSEGVYITSYGITKPFIIKKMILLCIEHHSRNPKIRYKFSAYFQSKNEAVMGIPLFITPAIRLILKEE